MARAKSASAAKDSAAHLGFEAKLWLAADKLRNNMDAAEYKHVVLGLTRSDVPERRLESDPREHGCIR